MAVNPVSSEFFNSVHATRLYRRIRYRLLTLYASVLKRIVKHFANVLRSHAFYLTPKPLLKMSDQNISHTEPRYDNVFD